MIAVTTRVIRGLLLTAVGVGLVGLSACGGEMPGDGPESTATTSEQLGESTCATISANNTQSSYISPDINTPTTYDRSGCYKSYIVDVNAPFGNHTDTVTANGDGSTQASCEDQVMWMQPYARSGSTFVADGPKQRAQGQWVCGGSLCLGCIFPTLQYGHSGGKIRMAASARSIATGATIPMTFSSYLNPT